MIIVMSDDVFRKNLIYLRKKYSVSRRALAKLIGASEWVLQCIEEGTAYPEMQIESFQRICEVFHIHSADLTQIDLSMLNV